MQVGRQQLRQLGCQTSVPPAIQTGALGRLAGRLTDCRKREVWRGAGMRRARPLADWCTCGRRARRFTDARRQVDKRV